MSEELLNAITASAPPEKVSGAEQKQDTKSDNKKQDPKSAKKDESWGYDLYPERRGTFEPKLSNILIGKEGRENIDKLKCEQNVYKCVKTSK